jgi:glycosyltransferase involved in cell wall biosynthesis
MSRPRRILHVVGGMDRGGIETWLMHLLRNIDRQRFRMDFLVHTESACAYDNEVRSLGARLLPCPYAHRPLAYASRFRQLLAENSPYDVVHSHVHYFNGFVMRLARSAGIPIRIAHSHNDPASAEARRGLIRHGYRWLSTRWIQRYSTSGAGASRLAAASLFGPDWDTQNRWRTLSYSLDLKPFRVPPSRLSACGELGIPPDAFLVGHVGRFVDQKNHPFLIRVAECLMRLEPSTRLVLLGDGPNRQAIEQQAEAAGIRNAIHFLGVRSNVPRILLGAMDLFLFPSHFEGLGLAIVEAQAAGLPCLISQAVPEEADVVPRLVRRLSLNDAPEAWAQSAAILRSTPTPVTRDAALSAVEASSFNIATGVRLMEEMYGG